MVAYEHTPEMRRIRAADIRISLRMIPGDPARTPIVFLHEGLGCIGMWRDFPAELCRRTGRPGCIYERKGYGGSTLFEGKWARDYLVHESTRYLPAVLDALELDRAILLGHSDGGTIALMGAAAFPERIAAAVTLAAHIFVEPETTAGIRQAVAAYATTNLKQRLAKYHGANTDTAFFRWADTWLDPDFRDWNIEHLLPRITSPLLIIQGAADEYATARQVTGIASQVSGPVSTLMISGCGHIPHLEAPETVLMEVTEFLSETW